MTEDSKADMTEFPMAGGFILVSEPEPTTEPEPQENADTRIADLVDHMSARARLVRQEHTDGDLLEILRADPEWQDLSRRVKQVVVGAQEESEQC